MQYVHVIWLNLQHLCVLWDHKHTYAVEYTIQHLYVILLHNLTFMFGQVGSPGLDTDNLTETSGVLTCFRVPTCFCVSVGSLQSYYTCLVYENIYSICISYKDTCSMYMQFTTNHDVYMSLNNTWCSQYTCIPWLYCRNGMRDPENVGLVVWRGKEGREKRRPWKENRGNLESYLKTSAMHRLNYYVSL